MASAKAISTLMMSGSRPFARYGEKLSDVRFYQSIVGALQYATLTRLGISFNVNNACQFIHASTVTHWQLVKKVF